MAVTSKSPAQVMAFDPDSINPATGSVNWEEFGVASDKKIKSHLPRRLGLGAFSSKFGWRPSGLNVGQVKLFVERFPQEFRLASLGRIILPHWKGSPFIAPDGKLPCPLLSSCNAIKVLQGPGKLDGAHKKVRAELERVFNDGLQVEWQEFADYMSYMVYYEGAAVQGEVLVKPHILDTALLFLGFCASKRGRALQLQTAAAKGSGTNDAKTAPEGIDASDAKAQPSDTSLVTAEAAEAAGSGGTLAIAPTPAEVLDSTAKVWDFVLEDGCKALEEGFIEAMNGKAAHRFYDAKKLLRSTEPAVLTSLSMWRKRAHFCHANALSQQWFLTTEWRQLKNCTLRHEVIDHAFQKQAPEASLHQSLSLQQCCADIIIKMLSQTEITKKADIPKLGRSLVTADVFKEVVTIPIPAIEYFNGLRQKHPQSWSMLPAGSKLARRLLVDGEPGLRQTFLAVYEQMRRSVCAVTFMDTAVGSDFAMVEEKLNSNTLKLQSEAKQAEEAERAKRAEAQKEQEAAKAQSEAAKADDEAVDDLLSGIFAEGDGGTEGEGEAAKEIVTVEQMQQELARQNRLREEAAAEQERQAAAERKRKEEKMEADAIGSEARIAIDDVWTIYNDVPRKGCPPVTKVQSTQHVVYVVPTQSYVRGRPEAATPVLQMQGLEILDWVTAKDMILVGVGHDPTVVTVLVTKLKAQAENIKLFQWLPLIPIVQPKKTNSAAAGSYLEYMLIGFGPDYKSSPNGPNPPAFLQMRRGFPSLRLRPAHCSKCVAGTQLSGRSAESCDTMCDVHTWARSRFTSCLPGNPPKRQKKVREAGDNGDLADLMGEADDSASDDGSGDGGVIGDAGDSEHSEEEGMPLVQHHGNGKRKPWLNAWRWGWPSETWTAFLESLSPKLVVLCGSMHLQPGLLMSILSYNDARFGLDRCEIIAFYPRDCASQDVDARPRAKHVEQGHIADHVLERVSSAYADFRLTAHRAARKRQLARAGSAEGESLALVPVPPTPGAAGITAATPSGAAPAPAPTAGAAAEGLTASAAEPGEGKDDAGSSGVTASKFIGIYGNAGPRMSLIALPSTKSDDDSDTDETGASAASMVHAEVSKRNQNMMSKHKVKVSKSTGPDGTGVGLFSEQALPAGTSIPVKGIWFQSLGDLNAWLGAQPTRTADVMAKKVVEANFCKLPDADTKVVMYFLMTSIAGYVNAYTNIAQRPNTQLVFDCDRPLGQYSLKLVLTQDLPESREILIAYGAKHMVRDRKPRGPKGQGSKRKRISSPAGPAPSKQADDLA